VKEYKFMGNKKQKNELITGLDIGSNSIRIAVGQLIDREGVNPLLQIAALAQVSSEGVHKGMVTSIEEAVSSVSNALEQAEHIIGVPIEHVWVGMSGLNVICQQSKGVVAVAKADGEIGPEDVERAVQAARTVASPLNYEILHVIPKTFSVDGQTGIKDPVGMTGIRLEVDAQIIQASASNIKNLTKAVYRTGVDIDDLVLSILASGEAVITARQKELGVAVVDIGGSITNLIVYEEGDIIHTAVLPIGSDHVTNDIAIGLRTSIDAAERVKIDFGQCISRDISKKDMIDLNEAGNSMSEIVSRRYVAEIIEARMEEIMAKIDEELRKIGRSCLLPAGVVFTGGGAKITGLIELAKETLKLPASLGYPIDIQSVTDKINDLAFTTAVGLVKWGTQIQKHEGISTGNKFRGVDKVTEHVRKWFKSLVP